MKKTTAILLASMSLLLNGCESLTESEGLAASSTPELHTQNTPELHTQNTAELQTESAPDSSASEMRTENAEPAAPESAGAESVNVTQGGPYGSISVTLPTGWSSETYPIDSDGLLSGMYGIHFYPEEVSNGYISVVYMDSFGVCGTGLLEETATVAGASAWIGTYDGHDYWDFINFDGEYEGIVAMTYFVDEWWNGYAAQVMDILNTLSFDREQKEGGAYVYNAESEISGIGLYFSLKNISSTGATLVFRQYDADAPTGELEYGEDFVIEQRKDDKWEPVPVILDNDYGFDAVAYSITAGDTSERELSWEWLYGALAPGEYRIKKVVNDFRSSGDYSQYTICARFILN